MSKLPIAPFERILKESENNIRVSEKAASEFAEFIEDLAKDVAREISEIAKHSGRNTILERDVKIIAKKLNKK